MGALTGRVAVVTGAGRGLGREHALLLAREGARVVVNDLGGGSDGSGSDHGPAADVVAEIQAAGGHAVANTDDVADWHGAERLVGAAVDAFGGLDILVNNAGILRDRMLVNMTEEEWDSVMTVHLKGHFLPLRWAATYWRGQAKAGLRVAASVINTSSGSGLLSNPGQANYGAAKSGIATLTLIAAKELGRYGVRVNAIVPVARTRMTLATPGFDDHADPRGDGFDAFAPANVSPLVAYLATERCTVTGGVFHVAGNQVGLFQGWQLSSVLQAQGRWTVAELEERMPSLTGGRPAIVSESGDDVQEIFTSLVAAQV